MALHALKRHVKFCDLSPRPRGKSLLTRWRRMTNTAAQIISLDARQKLCAGKLGQELALVRSDGEKFCQTS